jgi:hypothetical protein
VAATLPLVPSSLHEFKTMDLRVYPDWMMQSAEAVLDVIESDFGQSGRDVRLEAIRCELWEAHERGLNADSASSVTTEKS